MGNQPSTRIPSPVRSSFDDKDEFMHVTDALESLAVATPMSADGSLTLGHVSSWEANASVNPKVQLARTVFAQSDIRDVLKSRASRIKETHVFNHSIDFKTGPITNQKSSGRCWLFATTNVLRYGIMRRLKLKEFQLSQAS